MKDIHYMCKEMEDMCNEAMDEQAIKCIHNIMETMGFTVEYTMDILEVPESKRPTYRAALLNTKE